MLLYTTNVLMGFLCVAVNSRQQIGGSMKISVVLFGVVVWLLCGIAMIQMVKFANHSQSDLIGLVWLTVFIGIIFLFIICFSAVGTVRHVIFMTVMFKVVNKSKESVVVRFGFSDKDDVTLKPGHDNKVCTNLPNTITVLNSDKDKTLLRVCLLKRDGGKTVTVEILSSDKFAVQPPEIMFIVSQF